MILFLKLVLVYMLVANIFQPVARSGVNGAQYNFTKTFLWSIVYGATNFLVVWENEFWGMALISAVVYFLITATTEIISEKKSKKIWNLFIHLLAIVLIGVLWFHWTQPEIRIQKKYFGTGIILATAVVWLTLPTSRLIKTIISQWTPEDNETGSLQNAGKLIGILERLFVLIFVVSNHWEAIGFLIAAKSVFRFGDLKESKDRKLTEYILIGTLLSFGIALGTGVVVVVMLGR